MTLSIYEERKAERTLIVKMMELKSNGARRKFCESHEIPWDDWLAIKRKYKHLIKTYEASKN